MIIYNYKYMVLSHIDDANATLPKTKTQVFKNILPVNKERKIDTFASLKYHKEM